MWIQNWWQVSTVQEMQCWHSVSCKMATLLNELARGKMHSIPIGTNMEPMSTHRLNVVVYSADLFVIQQVQQCCCNCRCLGKWNEDKSGHQTTTCFSMTPKEWCRWMWHSTPHITVSGTTSRNVSTTTKCATNGCQNNYPTNRKWWMAIPLTNLKHKKCKGNNNVQCTVTRD